jgi:ergothioneine biosynthesis protein EgtB
LLTRPSVAEVFEYRQFVDDKMAQILSSVRAGDELFPIIELGLNHEQQHLELLLTDIKHAFAQNPLRPAYCDMPHSPAGASDWKAGATMEWRSFAEGVYEIGWAGAGFSFDNERPRHRVFLEAFEIGARPVSCGEYLRFMEDGGYSRPEFWLSDGWTVCRNGDWQAPLYWERHGTCWNVFTLGGLRPVAESQPILHLSFYEADAYARWSQCRLPTEAEWETACMESEVGPADDHDVFGPRCLHPAPLNNLRSGFFDDGWTWTQSPYVPYPGFKPAPGALGEYNGKFMCNQIVLRGGSCLTPRSHLRATYRNFFPPEARWQFTGLRLARSF